MATRQHRRRWRRVEKGSKGRSTVAARPPEIVSDPVESAQAAGLRYVSDMMPGIRRRKAGKGFVYLGTDGKPIHNEAELQRIRSLAIPPAYIDVWICPSPNGHIQATGRDARGRKQYRYHPKWREVRDETKFERMLAFSEVLPRIRRAVERDLQRPGLPREKVLATVVRLLESTCIRVGNDEYAKSNRSFGLTTLKDRHVEISGSNVTFEFRGKSGKTHRCSLTDRRLARIVQRCQALPGEDLFQYVDEEGVRQSIGSGDVNDYIREIAGEEFTAKDFRTWAGTILAVGALGEIGAFTTQRQAKSNVLQAIDRVADQLNNTRAVCRKYYVHPAVFDSYMAGTMQRILQNGTKPAAKSDLAADEQSIVRLLRHHLQSEGAR
ncbi:MAG TPA: DNA topoisomerase IB [Gemmatimonadales bacterium]|jgi:DNA topoisomerase-1|nr:DNA topoisomerase IB [Gemmatimonadales bacterium]